MSVMSIQPQPERLDRNMRLTQSNHDVIELVMEKEKLPTLNSALSLIIKMYRPFLKRSKAVNKVKKENKNGVSEFASLTPPSIKDLDQNEYEEPV